VIASLLAALVGAGGSVALAQMLSVTPRAPSALLVAALGLLPLAAVIYASYFIYRHTARRRKLQATATALLSTILTLAALFVASIILPPSNSAPPPPPAPTPTPRHIV